MEAKTIDRDGAPRRRSSRTKKKKRFDLSVFESCITRSGSTDYLLTLFALMLVIFGIIMIFSASYYYSISRNGTPYYYLIKHMCFVAGGIILFAGATMFDYHCYKKLAIPGIILGFILLMLLFTPLGATINSATRWINVGPLTLMPGEFAKLFAIIFTAWFISDKPGRIDHIVTGVGPVVALAVLYAGLIYKQPNLSTAITLIGIVGCMLIVAGLHKKYIVLAFGFVGMFIMALTTVLRNTYWFERLDNFWDPFADASGNGYQVAQSLLAMGSGGLFGVGLGKSVQKSLYLPEPQNDFILAIIGEELGFVGIMLLLLLYCAFIWRGVHIAIHARDQFGMLLASGIVLMVAIQVILNVAVVTALMPPTGINLPFVSYGGNAIWIFMASTGILANISRQNVKEEPKLEERAHEE